MKGGEEEGAEPWLAPVALAFYAASTGDGSFADALDLCRAALGADTMFYYVGRLEDGQRQDTQVSGLIERAHLELYTQRWARLNLRQRVWPEIPDNRIVDFDAVVPPAVFAETRVWREFMRHHIPMLHALGLAVAPAPGLQARFGIGRTPESGPFPPAARTRLAVIAPHLRRAACARLRMVGHAGAQALPAAAIEVLDVAIARYGRSGAFLGASPALRRIAARADGLALGPSGLTPARAGDRTALYAAIRSSRRAVRLPLARSGVAVPYIADVIPPDAGAMTTLVVVTDPLAPAAPDAASLASLFGLTEAQAALALDIAAGLSLRDHAAASGAPIETVRSRLKVVLARTGCTRQPELAALLARLPGGG